MSTQATNTGKQAEKDKGFIFTVDNIKSFGQVVKSLGVAQIIALYMVYSMMNIFTSHLTEVKSSLTKIALTLERLEQKTTGASVRQDFSGIGSGFR